MRRKYHSLVGALALSTALAVPLAAAVAKESPSGVSMNSLSGAYLAARVAERGVQGFLRFAGVLEGEARAQGAPRTTTLLDMPDASCFTTSEHEGLLEICRDLGETVVQGDLLARVYDTVRLGSPGIEYRAKRDGIVAARHFPGIVKAGDTIAVVADVLERGIATAG